MNRRPLVPQTSALTGLRHAPNQSQLKMLNSSKTILAYPCISNLVTSILHFFRLKTKRTVALPMIYPPIIGKTHALREVVLGHAKFEYT